MTREEAKKYLIEIGVAEPSEAQITAYLNQYHTFNAGNASNATKLEEEKKRADDLQKKLDEIEQSQMTELQQEKKAREKAENKVKELQASLTRTNVEKVFAAGGLTGDFYEGVITALSAMETEAAIKSATSFVDGISQANTTALETAKANWEKEILSQTANPNGVAANNNNNDDTKSYIAEYAINYSNSKMPKGSE